MTQFVRCARRVGRKAALESATGASSAATPRIGLVINDIPTVESKAPSQFGGVLLASARHAPLAPDKRATTHTIHSLWCTEYTAA